MSFIRGIAVAAMVASLTIGAANAQNAAATVGTITGPQGSVLVLRGGETYFLTQGDRLFEGDQIFTRANGSVVIEAPGCNKTVDPATSIIYNGTFCAAGLVQLASTDVVGGVTIGTTAAGGIGAAPVLLGLLGAGGVAAAAGGGGGGGGGAPASP